MMADSRTLAELAIRARRQLDDDELDSGDDEDRDDRLSDDDDNDMVEEDEPMEEEQFNFMDAELSRHAIPDPSDNEVRPVYGELLNSADSYTKLYLVKVPRFLSIDPMAWHHKTFQPPTTDHHSNGPASATFSRYNTAATTIRWRHSPSDPKELQSNARILRWSDGSLTVQLASDPTIQYETDGNPLAPRQRNPPKPTPTSIQDKKSRTNATSTPYNPSHDSFTYLAAPNESAALLRVTNKITAGVTILPSADTTDDAVQRLQSSLAAAVRGKNLNPDGGVALVSMVEDPELAKKAAELAEREKQRAQRRRELMETRERERTGRPRTAFRTGGLTVGSLEEDDADAGAGGARARLGGRARLRRHKKDDYSDEEDFGRRKTKEDGYDEEDEFIAKSDEEEEVADDDEDEDIDEGIARAEKERRSRRAKDKGGRKEAGSPKRDRRGGDEVDAEGEEEEVGAAVPRTKRRRVVDDDEDEEE